jgi:hypothetical protein
MGDEPLVADFGVISVERYATLSLCGESSFRPGHVDLVKCSADSGEWKKF